MLTVTTITELLYWTFALGATVSGFMVISSTNPVHSIFSLILVFANTSALLLLIGQGGAAEYLAFLFIIVYVGAIAILFLFVVMMLNIKLVEMIDPAASRPAIFIGGIIGPGGIFLTEAYGWIAPHQQGLRAHEAPGAGLTGPYWTPPVGGAVAAVDGAIQGRDNLYAVGVALFSPDGGVQGYVIIASLILFVAMVGAIVLTLSHEKGIKRQDIFSQVQATPDAQGARSRFA